MPYEILLQHASIVSCLCVFGISHFGLYYLYSSTKWTGNPVKGENKKKVRLVTEQIERAADIYHTWQSEGTDGTNYEVPELYRSVGIDEIESKGWTLTPSKYIEFIDRDLDIDYEKEMARIQAEMKEVLAQEKKSQQMLEDAFRGIGYGID